MNNLIENNLNIINNNDKNVHDELVSSTDLLGLSSSNNNNNDFGDFISSSTQSFMPSQLLLNDDMSNLFDFTQNEPKSSGDSPSMTSSSSSSSTKQMNSIMNLFNKSTIPTSSKSSVVLQKDRIIQNKEKLNRKDKSAWFQLFSELDPLANPDLMETKICENINNYQSA